MKTKVKIQLKSEKTNKNFNVIIDFADVEKGWFVEELNKNISEETMMNSFSGYWEKARQQFRNNNIGVEFEIKKTYWDDKFLGFDLYVDGKRMSKEIKIALIKTPIKEEKYIAEESVIGEKEYKEKIKKENEMKKAYKRSQMFYY